MKGYGYHFEGTSIYQSKIRKATPLEKFVIALIILDIFGTAAVTVFTRNFAFVVPGIGIAFILLGVFIRLFWGAGAIKLWILFVVIGIALLGGMLLAQFISNPLMLPMIGMEILFLGLGVGLLAIGLSNKKLQKQGGIKVMATCIRIEEQRVRTNYYGSQTRPVAMVRPVYSVYFNGNNYELKQDYYVSDLRVKPGDKVEVTLDPQNPDKFFDGNNKYYKMYIVLGISFIFIALLLGIILIGIFMVFKGMGILF